MNETSSYMPDSAPSPSPGIDEMLTKHETVPGTVHVAPLLACSLLHRRVCSALRAQPTLLSRTQPKPHPSYSPSASGHCPGTSTDSARSRPQAPTPRHAATSTKARGSLSLSCLSPAPAQAHPIERWAPPDTGCLGALRTKERSPGSGWSGRSRFDHEAGNPRPAGRSSCRRS